MDEKRYFQGEDGVELAYRRWTPVQSERNMPIVLLHGAASNSTRWWHFVKHSHLANDRLLLRPDLRGHGESIWRGAARIKDWSQDIASMLNHEQQAQAFVVGHCLGANIALGFASRFPDRCAGLVLIEPMAREAIMGILVWLRRLLPVLHLALGLIKLINRLGFYRRQLETLDLQLLDRRLHEANHTQLKEILADYGSPWLDIKTMPTVQYLSNLIELMQPLPVAAVHCPCLVIQSRGRSITDAKRTQTALAALPQVEFVTIDSDHWLPATHPDHLRALIDTWVLKNHTLR
ncbi:MAG: alpha/beta hydrolase [Nitrosomonas sp.]|uniref:alpha/beta fold hydrolase n=1 Tax=Nitrosomonas sp. TaxID=42353 RepID=UPI0025F80E92|nr:alpha/beta hydrolase [Nitrosomonas sp.]MBY0475718.1 alpha/beta hydrolase [Nitrosomonas sp.]